MTKKKFLAFEKVRKKGDVNMFDLPKVTEEMARSGVQLTREDFLDILRDYRKYQRKYDVPSEVVQDEKKEKFRIFEKIRSSNAVDMTDLHSVKMSALGYGQTLTEEECFDMLFKYEQYKKQYGIENDTKHE